MHNFGFAVAFISLLLLYTPTHADTFTYDSTLNCTDGCLFNDPHTWLDGNGTVPGSSDDVVLESSEPALLYVNAFVGVNSVRMNGNMTLVVENILNVTDTVLWNETSMLEVTGGEVNAHYLAGSSLVASNASLHCSQASLEYLYTNMSSIVTTRIIVDVLYASGGVLPSTFYVYINATFSEYFYLQLNSLITGSNFVTLELNNCNSSIGTLRMSPGSTITYTSTTPSTTGYIKSVYLYEPDEPGYIPYVLTVGDGFDLSIEQGVLDTVVVGPRALLNFVGSPTNNVLVNSFRQTAPGALTINTNLYITGNTSFIGTISVEGRLVLEADFDVSVPPIDNQCPVIGLGSVLLQNGTLSCPGKLTIGTMEIGKGSLMVGSLQTLTLSNSAPNGYVAGDVVIRKTLNVLQSSLLVAGNYAQETGLIHFSKGVASLRYLSSNKGISLSNLVISLSGFVTKLEEDVSNLTIPLMEAASFATLNISIIDTTMEDSLSVEVVLNGTTLSALYKRAHSSSASPTLLQRLKDHWLYFAVGGGVLVVAIVGCLVVRGLRSKRKGYQSV